MKLAKQMWVHPSFLKKMKKDAVDKDMSIIDYTKFLSNEPFNNFESINNEVKQEERRRKTYLGLRL